MVDGRMSAMTVLALTGNQQICVGDGVDVLEVYTRESYEEGDYVMVYTSAKGDAVVVGLVSPATTNKDSRAIRTDVQHTRW